MSTIVGNIILDIQATQPELEAEVIARALALISGVILLFIGLTRLGFIVEFIPLTAIGAFMTGSAISIAAGQVPTMMGISTVKTREETYKVIINTLKHLGDTRLDAAMGLSALFGLYFIRWFCGFMGQRSPTRSKMWFFISTLRMAFIVILYILVSWLVNRGVSDSKNAKFKILGNVPSGKWLRLTIHLRDLADWCRVQVSNMLVLLKSTLRFCPPSHLIFRSPLSSC